MKNYYEILNIQESTGSLKIFKEFKKLYLNTNNKLNRLELLSAYFVLQETSRKFYNISLKQYNNGEKINPNYKSVVEYQEKRARDIIDYDKKKFELLNKYLTDYPIGASSIETIELVTGNNIGWTALGISLSLFGIISIGKNIINAQWYLLLISLILFIIGVFMHNHGILKIKKEKTEKLTTHNIN